MTKRGPAFTAEALGAWAATATWRSRACPGTTASTAAVDLGGLGNVNALDVLRALGRSPPPRALFGELALARGADARLDAAVARLESGLTEASETGARRLVEPMALTLQASLLVRRPPARRRGRVLRESARRRLGHAFGTLPAGADLGGILARALPGEG
ncbi:hypothetical protein LV779_39385 [Streptomyces thinghirensis]|nr:hypothetical protein [Streptomyces thinghirensis]